MKLGVLTDPLQPDKALAAVVGNRPRPRSEILKQLWQYIKEKSLQDTARRVIRADHRRLAVLGGKKEVSIFQVFSLVNDHLRRPRGK